MVNFLQIIEDISSKNENVRFNSSSNVLTIYGSHFIIYMDKKKESNKVIIDLNNLKFKIISDWGGTTSGTYSVEPQYYDLKWFSSLTWEEVEWYKKSGVHKGFYFIHNLQKSHVGWYGSKFTLMVEPVLVELMSIIPDWVSFRRKTIEQEKLSLRLEEIKQREELELRERGRIAKLKESQSTILSELDKDGNGEVDVTEGNDFNLLLKKHQKTIVEVDRNYVQQFVKVSSYLKTKKGNIQFIFNSIRDTPNQEVLNEHVEILKGEIHTYNLVLFNSLNMIVSLVEDDMIIFYEIYEMFDTLNMFDSKHEKDVSQRLTNIGDGLESLMYEIRDMSDSINNSIGELSYVTEQSNRQLTEQLSEIDSSVKTNNLLTTIQTYQTYKINKNTRGLRE